MENRVIVSSSRALEKKRKKKENEMKKRNAKGHQTSSFTYFLVHNWGSCWEFPFISQWASTIKLTKERFLLLDECLFNMSRVSFFLVPGLKTQSSC